MGHHLGVAPSAIKIGMVRVAERLGRLKLSGSLLKRSALSTVIELETLIVGVRGKDALWTALQAADVSLKNVDLEALAESARGQAAELETLRLRAATRAFVQDANRTPAHQVVA